MVNIIHPMNWPLPPTHPPPNLTFFVFFFFVTPARKIHLTYNLGRARPWPRGLRSLPPMPREGGRGRYPAPSRLQCGGLLTTESSRRPPSWWQPFSSAKRRLSNLRCVFPPLFFLFFSSLVLTCQFFLEWWRVWWELMGYLYTPFKEWDKALSLPSTFSVRTHVQYVLLLWMLLGGFPTPWSSF